MALKSLVATYERLVRPTSASISSKESSVFVPELDKGMDKCKNKTKLNLGRTSIISFDLDSKPSWPRSNIKNTYKNPFSYQNIHKKNKKYRQKYRSHSFEYDEIDREVAGVLDFNKRNCACRLSEECCLRIGLGWK